MERHLLLFPLLLFTALLFGQNTINGWESKIIEFEAKDKENLSKNYKDWIVFTGSSSFRRWEGMEAAFPDKHIVNRGFGGSNIPDLIQYYQRIIIPYQPKQVLIYSGDNDIGSGRKAETVLEDFKTLFGLLRKELPNTQITFVSIKPSPIRLHLMEEQKKTNKLIEDYIKNQKRANYIDVFNSMVNDSGRPIGSLFIADSLHMNKKGYELWTQKIKPKLK